MPMLSMYLNLAIFLLTVISTVWMISGFSLSSKVSSMTASRLFVFRYFTVDSNVFAGLVSLILFLYLFLNRSSPAGQLPTCLWVLKLMATSGVTLTLLITCCFLAPTSENGYLSLFRNSNLFFHLVIPLLCIVSFVFTEKDGSMPLICSLYGLIPTAVYGIYYLTRCFSHIEGGSISPEYDFYRFFAGGTRFIPLVLLSLFVFNFLISFLLVLCNRSA